MPVRKEFRKFYRGKAWNEARRACLERAGGVHEVTRRKRYRYIGGAACENCGMPDYRDRQGRKRLVWVFSRSSVQCWSASLGPARTQAKSPDPAMEASAILGPAQTWRSCMDGSPVDFILEGSELAGAHTIRNVIQVCHLNQTPGDDRPSNLAALCGYCHLRYDSGQHKTSRSLRKDAQRPLLAVLEEKTT